MKEYSEEYFPSQKQISEHTAIAGNPFKLFPQHFCKSDSSLVKLFIKRTFSSL